MPTSSHLFAMNDFNFTWHKTTNTPQFAHSQLLSLHNSYHGAFINFSIVTKLFAKCSSHTQTHTGDVMCDAQNILNANGKIMDKSYIFIFTNVIV